MRLDNNGVLGSTLVGHIQRFHIEEFLAFELKEQFSTFQTSGLFEISGDFTSLTTGAQARFNVVTNGTS